jgi:hypothetical protein
MSKLLDAVDILTEARNCVECLFMASGDLSQEEADPMQAVANIASHKIEEAIAVLEEYRGSVDAPAPAAASAEPVSPTARTKRGRK